jgi:TonB family protein
MPLAQSTKRYNLHHMKLLQGTSLIFVLLLSALGFSADVREIPSEDAAKHLKRKVEPVYPTERSVRIRGDVVLQLEISESGTVNAIKAISGNPILIQAAIEAVKQWQYRAFLVNGKPVAVKTTVTIPFWPPYTREEALRENNTSESFFKTMDLCRKQIASQELKAAEVTCKKTIALSAELDEGRQLERLEALRETGHALFLQRKFAEALEQYRAELAIAEKTLKPDEAELAAAQHDVGNALWGTGRTEEARVQYEKAESTYKQAAAHIDSTFLKNEYAKRLKLVLTDHATLLRQMGRSAQADALDKESAAVVIKQGLRDE